MQLVLAICGADKIDDEAERAVELLNHLDISLEHRRQYLHQLSTPIKRLQAIKDQALWSLTVSEGYVINSEENIDAYANYGGGLDEELIAFNRSKIAGH